MQDFSQPLIIFRLDYGNALLYNIPLSLGSWWHLQNCAARLLKPHSQKGTYNTSFVSAALASCTFQITVQDSVSYVQSTEWKNINVSKRSDRKYIPVRMFRSESYSLLRVPKRHTALRLWNELPNHIKLAASKDIFSKVIKTHLFKLAYL